MSTAAPANAFVLPVTVTNSDIDGQGHASNVAAVAWMNRAAWEHSRSLGYGLNEYARLGGWFVVRRHEIDYRGRALLGEELHCHTWPSGMARATAERRHRIVRPADGAVIAEGFNIWAYVDVTTGRPLRIPAELREAFDPARFTASKPQINTDGHR